MHGHILDKVVHFFFIPIMPSVSHFSSTFLGMFHLLQCNFSSQSYFPFSASYKDLNPDAKAELEKDFTNTYDKNKDGKLEKDEVQRWLFPDEDMPLEEPPAMIKEADDDKDGKLSIDEILKNHKVFVDDPMANEKDHDEL